jgi:hypothetical protein
MMAVPITLYGIKNCDTMNKARAWLDKHGIDYSFHDYKTAGIERERLERLGEENWLGDSAEPRRHHLSQVVGQGQEWPRRQKGRGADAGAAVRDQAASP